MKAKKLHIVQDSKTKSLANFSPNKFDITKLKRIEDVIDSKTPSLNAFIKDIGEVKTNALIKLWLVNLNELLGVKNPMSENQIRLCASLIVEDYHHLKIADIGFFFRKIIKGDYGQFYENISIEKVLSFLTKYDNDRMEIIERDSYEKHLRQKNDWNNF